MGSTTNGSTLEQTKKIGWYHTRSAEEVVEKKEKIIQNACLLAKATADEQSRKSASAVRRKQSCSVTQAVNRVELQRLQRKRRRHNEKTR